MPDSFWALTDVHVDRPANGGALAFVQRCWSCKRRGVIEPLPQDLHARVGRAMRKAWEGGIAA